MPDSSAISPKRSAGKARHTHKRTHTHKHLNTHIHTHTHTHTHTRTHTHTHTHTHTCRTGGAGRHARGGVLPPLAPPLLPCRGPPKTGAAPCGVVRCVARCSGGQHLVQGGFDPSCLRTRSSGGPQTMNSGSHNLDSGPANVISGPQNVILGPHNVNWVSLWVVGLCSGFVEGGNISSCPRFSVFTRIGTRVRAHFFISLNPAQQNRVRCESPFSNL